MDKSYFARISIFVICAVCFVQLVDRLQGTSSFPTRRLSSAEVIDIVKNSNNLGRNRRELEGGGFLPGVDFANAIAASQDVLSLIRNRYELDKQQGKNFFLTANNLKAETWDIIKLKFAKKMVEGNSTFLMIFGGSSVTAGHDNYYNQSFPLIVQKRMGPILKLLGIELVVHNIAQGANNCIPYNFCYESMGGMNPDFVAWEQVTTICMLKLFVYCLTITIIHIGTIYCLHCI